MSLIDSMCRSNIQLKQISFEFFPPKSEVGEKQLWATINQLRHFNPDFASVTYGAGGSTREKTYQIVVKLIKDSVFRPAAHLTCVGASRTEVDAVVNIYKQLGVKHIVALRGDPPKNSVQFQPHPYGYQNAADLVSGISRLGFSEITVAAYPERHPESPDWEHEIDNLKRKIDAGATQAITQFFFDNNLFENFLERVRTAGISIPIVPGLLPIYNFSQMQNFAMRCGATIPTWLIKVFDGLENNIQTQQFISATLLINQVNDLMARGINHFHFYTLNRSDIIKVICHLLVTSKA